MTCRRLSLAIALGAWINVAAAWEGPYNLTSETNSVSGDYNPDLAHDSLGNLHFVWTDSTANIRHLIRYSDGAWSPITRVSVGQSNANWTRCTMDIWNNLHVVWHNGSTLANDEVYYRKRNADGTWGSVINLSNSGGVASIYADVAADSLGRVFAAWHEAVADGGDNWEVAMAIFNGTSWAPYQIVGSSNQIDAYPVLACDATNTLHLAYTYDYTEIYYKSRASDGTWSATANISSNSGSSRDPHLAVSAAGIPHVVWHDNTPGNWEYFYGTKVGGSWITPINMSNNSGTTDCYGSVAVGPDGTIHTTWVDYSKVYYSKNTGGGFSAPITLASQPNTKHAVVWVDAGNNVHVTWQGKTGSLDWDVYYMRNPAVTYAYQADFVSHNFPTQVIAGQTYSLSVTFKNTGTTTWNTSTTRLGTFHSRDRASAFYNPADWISASRLTAADSTVAPGQNGTFTFIAKAPAVPGSHTENFELVQEGVTWFESLGDNIQWNVSVVAAPSFDSVSVGPPALLADGTTQYQLTVKVTDLQGTSDLKGVAALFNRDWTNSANCRGFLSWGQTQADVTYFTYSMVVQGAATGGGYWGFDTTNWGSSYISPVSCTTSTSGNQRTIVWTLRVQPAWGSAGPTLGNYVGMMARGTYANTAWLDSTSLFGYSFNVVTYPPPPADFNSDSHVDSIDFDAFSACYNGPTNFVTGNCLQADFNGDQHVDANDFDTFSGCYNGPTNRPGC